MPYTALKKKITKTSAQALYPTTPEGGEGGGVERIINGHMANHQKNIYIYCQARPGAAPGPPETEKEN